MIYEAGADPAAGATPGLVQLATTTLGADAATIDFASISGAYQHVLLRLYVRGSTAATAINVHCRFNGDTASNYTYQWMNANNTSIAGARGTAQTACFIGFMPGSTATANLFSPIDASVAAYALATNKKWIQSQNSFASSHTDLQLYNFSNLWFGTPAAITSISLYPATGNFVAGSVATLYGLL